MSTGRVKKTQTTITVKTSAVVLRDLVMIIHAVLIVLLLPCCFLDSSTNLFCSSFPTSTITLSPSLSSSSYSSLPQRAVVGFFLSLSSSSSLSRLSSSQSSQRQQRTTKHSSTLSARHRYDHVANRIIFGRSRLLAMYLSSQEEDSPTTIISTQNDCPNSSNHHIMVDRVDVSRRNAVTNMMMTVAFVSSPALVVPTSVQAAASSDGGEEAVVPAASTQQQKTVRPAPDSIVYVTGRVTLPPDLMLSSTTTTMSAPTSTTTTSSSSAALYVTCRPDRLDNIPAAVLNGSRGKSPPVLSARFEISNVYQPPQKDVQGDNTVDSTSTAASSFPYTFTLTPDHLTPEGVYTTAKDGSTDVITKLEDIDLTNLWWKDDDLVVSVRYDTDGIAATRSPEDLVGRGIYSNNSKNNAVVEIQLTGRGAFGKFATGGGGGGKKY